MPFDSHIDLAISKPIGSSIHPYHSEILHICVLAWIHFIHFIEHLLGSFNLNLYVIQLWNICMQSAPLPLPPPKTTIFNQMFMVFFKNPYYVYWKLYFYSTLFFLVWWSGGIALHDDCGFCTHSNCPLPSTIHILFSC